MAKRKAKQELRPEFSHIEPTRYYSSSEAAVAIGESHDLLRVWRQRKKGPRYMQKHKKGTVRYRGSWLIEFLNASVIEPSK